MTTEQKTQNPAAGIQALIATLYSFLGTDHEVHSKIIAFGKTILHIPVSAYYGVNPIRLGEAYASRVIEFAVRGAEDLVEPVQQHMLELARAWVNENFENWMRQLDMVTSWHGDKIGATHLLEKIGLGIVETLESNADMVAMLRPKQKLALSLGFAAKTYQFDFEGSDAIIADMANALDIVVDISTSNAKSPEQFQCLIDASSASLKEAHPTPVPAA